MQDYKNNKILELIREIVKVPNQTDYEINGIDTSRAIYFYRKEKEKFKIIPLGSYTIVDEASNKYLRITDSSLLGEALEFQICYLFVKTSSSYVDEFPEITLLQEHYNQLYDDFNNLLNQLKSNNILGDTLKMSYVLPQLNEGQVWVLRQGEMKAENIFDLDERLKEALEQFKILFSKWVDEVEKPRFESFVDEKILSASDELDGKTELEKIELEDYTEQKKNELDIYLTGRKPIQYATIAELQASTNLKIGDYVEVTGYYSTGDGANHKRIISDSDDGSGVQLANNLWANIVHNGEVNVSWFGIKSNDISKEEFNSRQIEKIFNNNIVAVFDKGTYYMSDISLNTEVINIVGVSKEIFKDRTRKTFINTNGKNFISTFKEGQFKVVANDVDFVSGGEYVSNCFAGTSKQGEFNSYFKNVSIEGFKKGFYSENYSSNSYLENFSARKCFYGWFCKLSSNNATAFRVDLLSNVYGLRMSGLQSSIKNVHCGGGSIPAELITDLEYMYQVYGNNVEDLYIEAYGATVSDKMYVLAIPSLYQQGYSYCYRNIAFPYDGDFSNAKHIIFTEKFAPNNSEYTPITVKNCINQPTKIYTAKNLTFIPKILSESYIEGTNPIDYGIYLYCTNKTTPQKIDVEISDFSQKITNIGLDDVNYSIYNKNSKNLRIQEAGLYKIVVELSNVNFTKDVSLKIKVKEPNANEKNITKKFTKSELSQNIICSIDFMHSGFLDFPISIEGITTEELQNCALHIVLKKIEPLKKPTLNIYKQLDTTHYVEKMKTEGVYSDFISYTDKKTEYDNKKREEEKNLQEAYKVWLESNPDGTYEEFVNLIPNYNNLMLLPEGMESVNKEPQPSEALLKFKEKYLG